MKNIVISKEDNKKQSWTISQKIFTGWGILNLIISVCLALYGIFSKWGSTVIAIVWLSFLGLYIIIFTTVTLISARKNSDDFQHKIKDYMFGVKIFSSVSNMVNMLMTLSLLISASASGDMSARATIVSLSILGVFNLVGIILNVHFTLQRHKKRKKEYLKDNKQ